VIFVNGFRSGAYFDYLKKSVMPTSIIPTNNQAEPPWKTRGGAYSRTDRYGSNGESYWGSIDNMFMNKIGDHKALYTDGGFSPMSTGADRYSRGFNDGIALLKAITAGEIKVQRDENGNITESIKMVGHSHGGWHAAGMADAINYLGGKFGLDKITLEVLYLINPHQPNDKNAEIVGDYRSVQYSRPSDLLSSGVINGGKQRKMLRGILSTFGGSKMARMKGVDEKRDLKNLNTLQTIDGHLVDDANEIGQINEGEGVIEPRKDKKNE
jgi:hypothetical protein